MYKSYNNFNKRFVKAVLFEAVVPVSLPLFVFIACCIAISHENYNHTYAFITVI